MTSRAKQTQQQAAFEVICRDLLLGELVAGDTISIRSICERLSLGVMPVRESAARLVGMGILDADPNRTLRVRRYSRDEVQDFWAIREATEVRAAGNACRDVDAEFIHDLRGAWNALEQVTLKGSLREIMEANIGFHFRIYNRASSSILISTIQANWLRLGPLLSLSLSREGSLHDAYSASREDHLHLIEALAAADASKAKANLRRIIRASAQWYWERVKNIRDEEPRSPQALDAVFDSFV